MGRPYQLLPLLFRPVVVEEVQVEERGAGIVRQVVEQAAALVAYDAATWSLELPRSSEAKEVPGAPSSLLRSEWCALTAAQVADDRSRSTDPARRRAPGHSGRAIIGGVVPPARMATPALLACPGSSGR